MNEDSWSELFASSEARAFSGCPLRITDDGIWLPTPIDVIRSALEALSAIRLWDRMAPRPFVLDAGMGDGRFVACLGAHGEHVQALGIESDPTLHALAVSNLEELAISNARTSHGSFFDLAAYASLGVTPFDLDCVFHYPDGNEQPLAAFMRDHGRPGAFVVFLTPDLSLRIECLEHLTQRAVAQRYRLYLYQIQERLL